MKRVIILLSALSILSAGAVTPVLGMRFNNIAGASALPDAVTSIGLKMEITDGVNAGFDSNVTGDADFRIYLERSFGKIGFGHNAAKEPTFTIGGLYSIYNNLNVEVEYLVNTMTTDDTDQLRLSLTVPF